MRNRPSEPEVFARARARLPDYKIVRTITVPDTEPDFLKNLSPKKEAEMMARIRDYQAEIERKIVQTFCFPPPPPPPPPVHVVTLAIPYMPVVLKGPVA